MLARFSLSFSLSLPPLLRFARRYLTRLVECSGLLRRARRMAAHVSFQERQRARQARQSSRKQSRTRRATASPVRPFSLPCRPWLCPTLGAGSSILFYPYNSSLFSLFCLFFFMLDPTWAIFIFYFPALMLSVIPLCLPFACLILLSFSCPLC